MEMSSVNAKYTEHVMRGAKPMNIILRKVEKAMVQIKRDWFDTALENYERGEMYGRSFYLQKIIIFPKIIRPLNIRHMNSTLCQMLSTLCLP
jgi:hypothetical protein